MCGLVGFIGAGDESILRQMTNLLTHRGPDSSGYYLEKENQIYIGHRRLIVLDKNYGTQPMWDNDKNICVVFNGEIYNHKLLRQNLEELGHTFQTSHSDTEVLVYGWKQWGEKVLNKIDGMFSIGIYDKKNNLLFLARDRFGEKPLYYSAKKDSFIFGSEIKPILKHPIHQNTQFSNLSLQKFFAHGFFPSPHTPFEGIKKLPPGHLLKINLQNLSILIKCYWKFELNYQNTHKIKDDEWAEELEWLLHQSVSTRLNSDVPLGIFLSGGLDSSTILACASTKLTNSPINTFSIGFLDKTYDETIYAEEIANLFKTNHKKKYCDFNNAKQLIPNLLSQLDEPVGDPSILPTYMLCELARKDVTVILSGDGGDELFAGYDPFKIMTYAKLYNHIMPIKLHQGIKSFLSFLPHSDNNMSLDFVLRRGLRGLKNEESLWNPLWHAPMDPEEISELFHEPIDQENLFSEVIDVWNENRKLNIIDQTLLFYTRFYLPESILTKTDRSSMLHGLEVRSPMLSNDLVNFAQRMPSNLKFRNGKTKWILKKVMKKSLPNNIVDRKKKGFGIPLSKWLRDLPPPKESISNINNLFLTKRWQSHKEKKIDDRNALWCWLSLSQTYKR